MAFLIFDGIAGVGHDPTTSGFGSAKYYSLTNGCLSVFVQILWCYVNLAIIPFQSIGKHIAAELGNIAEFLENRILGDNRTEVKDAAGPIIEDHLDLIVLYVVCLCNLPWLLTIRSFTPRIHYLFTMKRKPFEDKTKCPFRHFTTNGSVRDIYRNFLIPVLCVKVRRIMVKESEINE